MEGLAVWLDGFVGRPPDAPARGVRISIEGLAAAAAAAAVVAAVVGAVVGAVFGLVVGTGLMGVPGDLAGITGPGAVLARDRQVALLLILVSGLGAGLGKQADHCTAGIALAATLLACPSTAITAPP